MGWNGHVDIGGRANLLDGICRLHRVPATTLEGLAYDLGGTGLRPYSYRPCLVLSLCS